MDYRRVSYGLPKTSQPRSNTERAAYAKDVKTIHAFFVAYGYRFSVVGPYLQHAPRCEEPGLFRVKVRKIGTMRKELYY